MNYSRSISLVRNASCLMIIRVRNSANPCVRDMSKSLRTYQMSVHGYPVDMSIFCNLQLGLLELQEETARCSWSHSLIPPCSRCCWTIIRGFHTIAGGTEHAVGTRLDAVFPILQRLVHADLAAVERGFYAQCWSCFSELDVGWSEPFLFIFLPTGTLF